MAKQRARKGEFWLVREAHCGGRYVTYPSNASLTWGTDSWESNMTHVDVFDANEWGRHYPKELHLKPGGGPIRIRVEKVKPLRLPHLPHEPAYPQEC